MSFKVITPVDITDAILVSSTIPEPDTGEVEWTVGETVSLGSIRYKNHVLYEALTDAESGNDPEDEVQNDIDNPPTKWLEVGRTNQWNMFNLYRNIQSITTSPCTFRLAPGVRINSIGLFGISADEVTISQQNGMDDTFTYTENLNTREVSDFYDYFYEPFTNKPSTVLFNIPPITTGVITVTLTSTSGTVMLGSCVIGNFTNIGNVIYGAESDALNFSRIDRAFDGTSLLKVRQSKPKVLAEVVADKNRTNKIRDLRVDLNAVPAVWAGIDQTDDDYFESLLILGIYKKFTIKLDHPTATKTEIEIEEI